MRKIPILIAACLSVLASAAVAETAAESRKLDDFARRMFARNAFDQKAYACFVRTYDAAHLARHRRQTVTAMKMLMAAERLPENGQLSYSYKMRVNFRDRPGDYASSFQCGGAHMADVKGRAVEVTCHDGCEAGGLAIALAPDSKAIIIKLEDVSVWLAAKPEDQDAAFSFKGGADDRAFRLERVDLEACKPLMKDTDEVAALQPE
jgi:hypothetical protein